MSPAFKMWNAILGGLLYFLAFRQCHAQIPWVTVGCDQFELGGTPLDATAVWNNGKAMAANAMSQIDAIPTSLAGMTRTNARQAGANAEFMFNVNFKAISGLDTPGQATMSNVRTVFENILAGFNGNLNGVDNQDTFLFCGGYGLTYGVVPGSPLQNPTWYAPITRNGVTRNVVLSYAASNTQPCLEGQRTAAYAGRTFNAVVYTGNVRTEYNGVILCPNQWAPDGITAVPTLALNYPTSPAPGAKRPSAQDYNSIAGSMLHEMAHIVARAQGPAVATTWAQELGSCFDKCYDLARKDPRALTNADNYRVFAEMSMSPATKWGAPPKPQGS
ncbi:hypothetical protein BX600DRAFT_550542 [Xylariales sp. PMI_506]|nr:hypothetical protein BX600DRAFT_550542 [Xylariales sp. PMI_506]